MSIETSEKLYTVQDFMDLDLPDDQEYELIGGRLVARPKAGTSGAHADVVFKIAGQLFSYLKANPVGKGYVEGSSTLGQPDGPNYVKPDVCFVAHGRTPARFRGPIPVAPDLAVEVWSPSDDTETIQNKIDAYLASGVHLIWSVYLLNKYVLVYHLNDPDIRLLNLKDELDGEDILPGFKLLVGTLFE